MDTRKIKLAQRPQEWFCADEADGRRYPPEVFGAPTVLHRLDRDPEPDLVRPGSQTPGVAPQAFADTRDKPGKPRRAFGQHLEGVPVGPGHDLEHLEDEVIGNISVEEIGHRIGENPARLLPLQVIAKAFRPEFEIKALFIGVTRYTAKALGEGPRVAVITARRHFGAARDRVPGCIGPLDCGLRL